MGQPAFLAGIAAADTTLLRVRITDLRRLMASATELSDVLLSAFDARRRLLTRLGEGGLVFVGDEDRDMHRLQEFAERNHVPYRTVLRSDTSAWAEVAATCALPDTGTGVVTGRGRILTQPTMRELAAVVGLDLSDLPDRARCEPSHRRRRPGRPGRRRRSRPQRADRPGALRPPDPRRRPGRTGGCRLWSLRGTRRHPRRGRRPGRAGRHVVADRELPRLPARDSRW